MNSKVSCILVEDETLQMQMLEQAVQQFPKLKIVGKAATLEEAYQLIVELEPAIAIMDVQFLGGTIYDLFERLEKARIAIPTTILVSAHDQQAVNAVNQYRDQIVFFIVKRNLDDHLSSAIDRAIAIHYNNINPPKYSSTSTNTQILIRSRGYMTFLPVEDILYTETKDGQSYLITVDNATFEVNYSLNRLIQNFPQLQLIRINRNIAVVPSKIYRINIGDRELELKFSTNEMTSFCIGNDYYNNLMMSITPGAPTS